MERHQPAALAVGREGAGLMIRYTPTPLSELVVRRIPMIKVRPGMLRVRDNGQPDEIIEVVRNNARNEPHYTVMTERFNDRVGTGGLHYGRTSRIRVYREDA